jgi:hypothetical protein
VYSRENSWVVLDRRLLLPGCEHECTTTLDVPPPQAHKVIRLPSLPPYLSVSIHVSSDPIHHPILTAFVSVVYRYRRSQLARSPWPALYSFLGFWRTKTLDYSR